MAARARSATAVACAATSAVVTTTRGHQKVLLGEGTVVLAVLKVLAEVSVVLAVPVVREVQEARAAHLDIKMLTTPYTQGSRT